MKEKNYYLTKSGEVMKFIGEKKGFKYSFLIKKKNLSKFIP